MANAKPGSPQPGSPAEDDSDKELMEHIRLYKRPRIVPPTEPAERSYGHGESERQRFEGHKFEGVDWRQFMVPEIEQALSILCDRPLLMNTLSSGIGGAAAALKAPAIKFDKHS